MAIEQAEQSPDEAARQFLQTVVIVGVAPPAVRWREPCLN